MSVVPADPLFYLLAITAATLLGLSKGGFFGLGLMGVPLMSLYVPPLQAAAILIPTVLAQDAFGAIQWVSGDVKAQHLALVAK